MRGLKFRQKLKQRFADSRGEDFHYWGYIDGGFVSPMGANYIEGEDQQYTGLKDKNGKEIYEGDIAKKLHCEAGEITFSGGAFRVNVKTPRGLRAYNLTQETADISEIIGNIYENQELLGE